MPLEVLNYFLFQFGSVGGEGFGNRSPKHSLDGNEFGHKSKYRITTINQTLFNHFPAFRDNCCLLFCLLMFIGGLYIYNSNNMNPDQTFCSGFIVFSSMIKLACSAFEYMQQL